MTFIVNIVLVSEVLAWDYYITHGQQQNVYTESEDNFYIDCDSVDAKIKFRIVNTGSANTSRNYKVYDPNKVEVDSGTIAANSTKWTNEILPANYTGNWRLKITGDPGKSIYVTGYVYKPELAIDPSGSMLFQMKEGGSNPNGQILNIYSDSSTPLGYWIAQRNDNRIKINGGSDVSGSGDDSVTITIDGSGLSGGNLYDIGDVIVTSPGANNSPQTLQILLQVDYLDPNFYSDFQNKEFSLLKDKVGVLEDAWFVKNLGDSGSTCCWEITKPVGGGDWLTIIPNQGTLVAPQTKYIDLEFNSNGLSTGVYTCNLELTSTDPNASGPYYAVVTLYVDPDPGPDWEIIYGSNPSPLPPYEIGQVLTFDQTIKKYRKYACTTIEIKLKII